MVGLKMCSDENIRTKENAHAVYNAPHPQMFPSRVRWLWCVLILVSQTATASDFRTLETRLAEKIAAITGPGVIALEITNRSSISSADVEAIRRSLISDLASAGVRVWEPDQAAAIAKLTFSGSLQNYVWVAEVRQGTSEPGVIIISIPHPESTPTSQTVMPISLHISPLISSPERVLDAAVLEGNPRKLLVLRADAVTVYDFKDNLWVQTEALAIAHTHPFPRDLRGRIILRRDHPLDAYLPGLACHSTSAAPLGMNCSQSDDPWPLQAQDSSVSSFFSPAQNFFTGALVPGVGKQKSAPAFYSAAAVPREKYSLWIFAGVDRQVHLLDGINQQTLEKVRWGSDIAGVHASCRPTSQVLAISAGDETTDSVQAFEFPDREPIAVSPKLNVNGKITALWSTQTGDGAIAVYRNADSGDYEAAQLNLTCSQ
jgi:hypothetical protein